MQEYVLENIPRFFWIENSADAPILTSEKKRRNICLNELGYNKAASKYRVLKKISWENGNKTSIALYA